MPKRTQYLALSLRRRLFFPWLVLRAAALLLLAVLLLHCRAAAAEGVLNGTFMCLNTLMPSLFPFILLSCLCTESRAAALLFRPFAPVLRRVFRLPSCAAPAVLLGLTAGYPTGAKITADLYRSGRLTREQAARLLCFCTAPGYAFAVSYVGGFLLKSTRTGLNLFFACTLAPLLFGFLLSHFAKKPENDSFLTRNTSGALVKAVQNGIRAAVSMCAFVIAFSMLLSVLHASGIFQGICAVLHVPLSEIGLTVPFLNALLTMGLEITAGVSRCVFWHLPVHILAFGLGFCGVCIHLQIFSFFDQTGFPLSKARYVLARVFNGLLSAVFYTALSRIFPEERPVFAEAAPLRTAYTPGSAAASAALLALSLFFLLTCALRPQQTPSKICGGNSAEKMLQ